MPTRSASTPAHHALEAGRRQQGNVGLRLNIRSATTGDGSGDPAGAAAADMCQELDEIEIIIRFRH
jgi:hypothetical protein